MLLACAAIIETCCHVLLQYTAVPKGSGAPLRTVTVKDAIGDLPPLTNGANVEDMQYAGAPQTQPFTKGTGVQPCLRIWHSAGLRKQ